MASLKIKTIKGKKYNYASKSFRLPGGKVATAEKILKPGQSPDSKEITDYLTEKEKNLVLEEARKKYLATDVFNSQEIRKIEENRLKYRNILRKLTKPQLKDLFDRFTVNFTYESNALEGNSLTLKDVAIIIGENITPKGKELREIFDARNSRKVVDGILRKKFKVSEIDLVKMHSTLVKDQGIKTGYKEIPNYILGKNLETTLPELVPKEMQELISWVNSNPERMHPLQLAAHAHAKFEKIHPFDDGNGRVGRFLLNTILVNNGYPPLIIRKTQRTSYLDALERFDYGYEKKLERLVLERHKETFGKFFKVYVKYL